MKNIVSALLVLIMAGAAFSTPRSLPPQSTISIVTDMVLSAESNKINDEFPAKTSMDIIADDGTILIPKGTDAIGKIVSLQQKSISVVLIRIKVGDKYIPLETAAIELVEKPKDGKGGVGKGVAVGVMVGSLVRPPGYGRKARGAVIGGVIGGAAAASKEQEQAQKQVLQVPKGTSLQFKLSNALVIDK